MHFSQLSGDSSRIQRSTYFVFQYFTSMYICKVYFSLTSSWRINVLFFLHFLLSQNSFMEGYRDFGEYGTAVDPVYPQVSPCAGKACLCVHRESGLYMWPAMRKLTSWPFFRKGFTGTRVISSLRATFCVTSLLE